MGERAGPPGGGGAALVTNLLLFHTASGLRGRTAAPRSARAPDRRQPHDRLLCAVIPCPCRAPSHRSRPFRRLFEQPLQPRAPYRLGLSPALLQKRPQNLIEAAG